MEKPSVRLFKPVADHLLPYNTFIDGEQVALASKLRSEIQFLLTKKNYPCIAAIQSFNKNDYQLGIYDQLGQATPERELRKDLKFFLEEQKKTKSTYLSFWAVFEPTSFSEEEFENALWKELSLLTSEDERITDWGQQTVSDPLNPSFRFSLFGTEFFVVGLHPKSSRLARRFSRPVLIFNIWEQFSELIRTGRYQPMIETNRKRDELFQGEANPMIVAHGDVWESIQFSGRQNPNSWKCPFSFLKRSNEK